MGPFNLISKTLNLIGEFSTINGPCRHLQAIELLIVQRAPFTIISLCRVDDHSVGMDLRVVRAARLMLELRDHQIPGPLNVRLAILRDTRLARFALNIVHGLADGLVMGL